MKFTIVTPSFNQCAFLEETLSSVTNQPGVELEYFVIDGGSTDGSVEVIKKYDRSISFWVSEKDTGQPEAINKGMKRATGEILAYLNSDDCYTPHALQFVHDYFCKNPDVDVLIGRTQFINEKSENIDGFVFKKIEEVNDYSILDTCNIPQPSTFFRKKVVDSIGLFDQTLHYVFDYDFWVRAYLNNFKFAFVEQTLSKFRLHNQSKTVKDYKEGKFEKDFLTIYAKYLHKDYRRERKKVLAKAYLNQLMLLIIHLQNGENHRIKTSDIWKKLIKLPRFHFYLPSYRIIFWMIFPLRYRKLFRSY